MHGDELPTFQKYQFAFTAHLRDPEQVPVPEGVEERRMAVYRELVYNNIESFLSTAFPVLRSIDTDSLWHHRVRQFLIHHRAHSPYFADIPREFLQFLQERYIPLEEDPPFLLELAHYEWVELALSILDTPAPLPVQISSERLLDTVFERSALAWPLAYAWPVHRIGPEFQPETPAEGPVFLVVWRDADDEIRFLEINAASARLLALLDEQAPGTPARQAVDDLAREMKHPDPEQLAIHACGLLSDWLERGILTTSTS